MSRVDYSSFDSFGLVAMVMHGGLGHVGTGYDCRRLYREPSHLHSKVEERGEGGSRNFLLTVLLRFRTSLFA